MATSLDIYILLILDIGKSQYWYSTSLGCTYILFILDIDGKSGLLLKVWVIVIKYVMTNYMYGSLIYAIG